jgi:hypothetical protein
MNALAGDIASIRIRALSIEVDRLKKRVAELEELCGIDDGELPPEAALVCRSAPRIEIIMRLLAKRDVVSRAAIVLAIGGREDCNEKMADCYIVTARKLLSEWGIELRTIRSIGWGIAREQRIVLRAKLKIDDRAEARAS